MIFSSFYLAEARFLFFSPSEEEAITSSLDNVQHPLKADKKVFTLSGSLIISADLWTVWINQQRVQADHPYLIDGNETYTVILDSDQKISLKNKDGITFGVNVT